MLCWSNFTRILNSLFNSLFSFIYQLDFFLRSEPISDAAMETRASDFATNAATAVAVARGWFFVIVHLRASVGVSATAEYQLTGSVCVDKRGSVRVTENPSSSGPSKSDRPRSPLKYTLFDRYPSRGTMRLVGGVERCRLKGYR